MNVIKSWCRKVKDEKWSSVLTRVIVRNYFILLKDKLDLAIEHSFSTYGMTGVQDIS